MTSLAAAPDQAETQEDFTEVWGTTGLKEHSGIIDEEFLHRLRGRNGVVVAQSGTGPDNSE